MAARSPALSFLAWLPQAALIGIARLLPYRARLAYASGFTRLLVAVVPDMRRRVDDNLRMIFPEMGAAERRRIRAAMANSFGRTMIEVMTRRDFQARARLDRPDRPRLGGAARGPRRRPRRAPRLRALRPVGGGPRRAHGQRASRPAR